MNRLLEMEVFAAVVDAGSISAAAERRSMAKSAVSKRLADLESRLGVSLLNRTTRRLSLTAAGEEFYGHCQKILGEVEAAEGAVADNDGRVAGKIRLTAPLSFGLEHLGPALNRFLALHPSVSVDIDFSDRRVDIVEEGFDLAIRISRLGDSTLMARRLADIRHVICASPDYWNRHGRPARPEDLARHMALRYTLAAQRSWSYTGPDGARGAVTVPGRSSANNGVYLAQAAAGGAGVIRMPLFIVYELLRDGLLEPVLTDYNWADINAWAVYPKTRFLPYRVRVLIDYLVDEFGQEPVWEQQSRSL